MDYKNDFYTFVNSKWLNNNKIPDDYPKWNVFSELQEDINKKLNKILKSDNIDNNIKITNDMIDKYIESFEEITI